MPHPHHSKPAAIVLLHAIAALAAVVCAGAAGSRLNAQTAPPADAFAGFAGRVQQYIDLSKKVEGQLSKLSPTSDPSKIDVHKKALAAAIQEARHDAKPGDIFGDAADLFRKIVRDDAQRRSARDTHAAMQEVPRQQPLQVNTAYPADQALATLPPLILARLPRLPDGLEYRFMGRDLILHDAASNLIVDFVHEAVPARR